VPWCVVLFCWSTQSELTPLSRCIFVRFLQGFVGVRGRGCVPHLVGEGKPRQPSHLCNALTCLCYCCSLICYIGAMSISVAVIVLPLHVYCCCCYAHATVMFMLAMFTMLLHAMLCSSDCHACLCYCHAIPCHVTIMPC